MKLVNKILLALLMALMTTSAIVARGQTPGGTITNPPAVAATKTRQRVVAKTPGTPQNTKVSNTPDSGDVLIMEDRPAKDTGAKTANPRRSDTSQAPAGNEQVKPALDAPVAADGDPAKDNRHEQASEEAAIVPYYNNFFNTYRLGPEDIISVNVFGQDRYSRAGITVPPSGRVSLALIPGGIFVNGKTVEEVAESIRKRYDEFIIDPQVSVSLDKASSYRYSVVGDVAQPGIRLMSRRLTVTEALSEAGGVLETGNRSKVVVLRRQANGNLEPITVNVSAIYKGKAPDITYLVPGDQILVPGNKLKSFQKIMTFFPVLNFARIFTGGIF